MLLEELLESLDSSRLSLLRMTDEEDVAELSIASSLELERSFSLEAGMTDEEDSAELSAEMIDDELVSANSAELGESSPEHAPKPTANAIAVIPAPIFLKSKFIFQTVPYKLINRSALLAEHVQSHQLLLVLL